MSKPRVFSVIVFNLHSSPLYLKGISITKHIMDFCTEPSDALKFKTISDAKESLAILRTVLPQETTARMDVLTFGIPRHESAVQP